jgi:hypothetical protein
VLAAALAGESQLTNSNPSFGQGTAGYARYLGASYADFGISDYMTEAISHLLHHDPRYFRKDSGTGWARVGYAYGQILSRMMTQEKGALIILRSLATPPH